MSKNFKNLVFEGGGIKGIAYGGALEVLNKMEILPGISRVAGTSAGAINAALLALGAKSDQVSDLIAQTNFKSFEDSGFFLFNILRVIRKFGWNKGDFFRQWMGEQVKKLTGIADFTFGDLDDEVKSENTKGFRHLYVVITNLTQQKSEVLSHENAAKIPIKDAVRMSMSIPLYFAAVKKEKHIIVDGGASYNYPINIFDNKKYLAKEENGAKVDYHTDENYVFNYETLGFRLDSRQVIEWAKRGWATPPTEIRGIKGYIGGLINFLMETANKSHLHKNDWNRTIFLDTLDVKTTDFELPESKIQELIISGIKCTEDYFKWRETDTLFSMYPV